MRILKIESLQPIKEVPWVDRDFLMLHACFQILKDFVEEEDGLNHADDDEFNAEVKELYDWWCRQDYGTQEIADKKDIEMLDRLIKIRCQLWT
jgi:hypothetical protein